jgi:hypothetical protein
MPTPISFYSKPISLSSSMSRLLLFGLWSGVLRGLLTGVIVLGSRYFTTFLPFVDFLTSVMLQLLPFTLILQHSLALHSNWQCPKIYIDYPALDSSQPFKYHLLLLMLEQCHKNDVIYCAHESYQKYKKQ